MLHETSAELGKPVLTPTVSFSWVSSCHCQETHFMLFCTFSPVPCHSGGCFGGNNSLCAQLLKIRYPALPGLEKPLTIVNNFPFLRVQQ